MSEQNQVEAPDMSTVERVFRYASDTIVEASRLRQDFQALSAEVNALRDDLGKLRRQNEFLDEQLTSVRQQRDEAKIRNNQLEAMVAERDLTIASLNRQLDEAVTSKHNLFDHLASAREERDNAQLRVMELEESEGKLRAKLAEVETKAAEIAKLFAPQASTSEPKLVETDPSVRRPGESEEEHRERTQPRDPVTQQWRSPYDPPVFDEPTDVKAPF